jgi:hypothetical protein
MSLLDIIEKYICCCSKKQRSIKLNIKRYNQRENNKKFKCLPLVERVWSKKRKKKYKRFPSYGL